MNFSSQIAPLLAAGGLGFINYYVASRLDLINFRSTDKKMILPFMLIWSILDYAVYLLIHALCSILFEHDLQEPISLILSIIVVFYGFLYLAVPIFNRIDSRINSVRRKSGLNPVQSGDPWSHLIQSPENQLLYIFDFYGKPITAGWLAFSESNSESTLTFNLASLPDYDPKQELNEFIAERSGTSFEAENKLRQYIDTDRKMIIVSIIPGLGDLDSK